MRTQGLAVGALCGFLSVVNAIPAVKHSGFVESCSVTTVYVTAAPTLSTATLVQLSNTPVIDYGGVIKSGSASTAQSGTSGFSVLESGSGIDSTSTAHLTSTVHQTVFLTRTIVGTGVTRTETIEVTHPTPSPLSAGYTLQTYASVESISSAAVIITSGSSMTASQATDTVSGNYAYPVETVKTRPSCSGDLVTCLETSALNVVFSADTKNTTSSQMIGSTSMPPEVYVIETLTVIPLAALPTVASSVDQTTILTVQSTVLSTMQVKFTDVASSILVVTSIVYGTGLPGTASVSSSTGSYSGVGASGWNMSISTTSFDVSSSGLATIGTAVSTTSAVDALSNTASTISSCSSSPINFSNSYIFPNATSSLAAKSGFTASPIPSTTSTLAGAASSGGFLSSPSTLSSLSQITDVAETESCIEIDSSTSAIDAVKSTSISSDMTGGSATLSLTVSSLLQTSSEAAWTESCSEENPATSKMDAGQSTVMSMTGASSLSSSSTLYSSAPSFMNSTKSPGYTFSTALSTSSIITSDVGSAQSTFSSFLASTISSLSSASTATSSLQLPSPSSPTSEPTTTTTITTKTSTPSLLPTSTSLTSNSVTSEITSVVTTFSGSSMPSSSSSLSSETGSSWSSWVSAAGISESSSTTTSTLTTSLLRTSASSTSPAENTCTESVASSSLISNSSATTSSILTFTTLITSTSLSNAGSSTSTTSIPVLSSTTAPSTSASSPTPTLCGEHGAFTLNFDDLPPLSAKDNSTAQPMPLFSPYHQFYFSAGWSIVPPPTDPYNPSSGQLLVEFLPASGSALGYTGALGNGESALLGCFNFNAIGMSLGCDSTGPDCDWQFTGLRYNNVTKATDTVTSQMTSTVACPALSGCDLVPVSLDNTFTNLTELRINVTVAGVDKIWWLDDLNLSWFDDSCDAGLCRVEHV